MDRKAALAHAVEVENQAAAAAKDRDAADARLRDALALATKEHATTEDADPPDVHSDDDDHKTHTDSDDHKTHAAQPDVNDAMLLHEDAAILNLHAQIVAVQNISSLIPIVLDVASTNYARWCEQFLLTVDKFSLDNHVIRDRPALG